LKDKLRSYAQTMGYDTDEEEWYSIEKTSLRKRICFSLFDYNG
jgi:hypothetical protein